MLNLKGLKKKNSREGKKDKLIRKYNVNIKD